VNSRERVIRTIEFKKPDKFPIYHAFLPGALAKYGEKLSRFIDEHPDDFGFVNFGFPKDLDVSPRLRELKEKSKKRYVDRWGCVWGERYRGIEGQVIEPVLKNKNLEDLERYEPPHPYFADREKFEEEKKKIEELRKIYYTLGIYDDRYSVYLGGFTIFQRLYYLRGMEELLIDMALGSKKFYALLDKVMNYLVEAISKCLKLGIDGLFFADDWGTQRNLMISPSVWRKIFKPRYKELFKLVHQANVHVFFHSDGNILDIIPDLIEIGVDVLNPQFSCMDLNELSEKTKGRICILTDLDRQFLLPFGTPKNIIEYVKKVVELFGTSKGGIILRGEIGPDVPFDNIKAMYCAFKKYRVNLE